MLVLLGISSIIGKLSSMLKSQLTKINLCMFLDWELKNKQSE